MDVLRLLISIEPIFVLSVAIGLASLARRLTAGSFDPGGFGPHVIHSVVASTARRSK